MTSTGYDSTTIEAIAYLLADQGITAEPQAGSDIKAPGLTVTLSQYTAIEVFKDPKSPAARPTYMAEIHYGYGFPEAITLDDPADPAGVAEAVAVFAHALRKRR
ncbi:hypothetical protein ACFY0R_37895 [Streptomyces sp. NPDC001633]|uniref:hypothetical protein n=1 Tax=Streptomyces sp. NPDC001633 TaxID=3364595 RepID=UPI0036860E2C